MAETSTEDIGLKSVSLRLEMETRLLDTEVREERWEERPEATDGEGEVDRGVKTSELSALRALDAIGGGRRAGILFSEDAEKRRERERGRWLPESLLSGGTREEEGTGFKAEADVGEDGNGLIVTAAMDVRPLRNMGL